MSTKLSALTAISAAAQYLYGISSTPTSFKIPVNAAWGVPQLDVSANLNPVTAGTSTLGAVTANWAQLTLTQAGSAGATGGTGIQFSDGASALGQFGWLTGVGFYFRLAASSNNRINFSLASITAARTITWPDASGTATLLGNTSVGSGNVVLDKAIVPTWLTGRFYTAPMSTGNATVTQNQLTAFPIWVPPGTTTVTLTAVCSAGVASTTLRMGIYADGGGKPTTLIVDAGTASTAASGNISISTAQTLNNGWYWLAAVWQGGASSPTVSLLNNSSAGSLANLVGVTSPFSSGPCTGFSQTGVSGALPSPWGATLTEITKPICVYIGT